MTSYASRQCFFFLGGGGGGGEWLCFARIFKEPIILRHSCEKASEVLLFRRMRIYTKLGWYRFNLNRKVLIFPKILCFPIGIFT